MYSAIIARPRISAIVPKNENNDKKKAPHGLVTYGANEFASVLNIAPEKVNSTPAASLPQSIFGNLAWFQSQATIGTNRYGVFTIVAIHSAIPITAGADI